MIEHRHAAPNRFCHRCGHPVDARGSSPKCDSCGFVAWADPPVAAVVVVRRPDGSVLLIRRTSGVVGEGKWSLPGGFVNRGEDVREAAAREVAEETGLAVAVTDALDVHMSLDDPEKPTIVIWFRGEGGLGDGRPGDDADAVGWFSLDDLPPLAFEADGERLQRL